ncbi:MAG: T9SS type A sorting domain-containing protein [Bacteroidetes bacterium]|nr:T9SS type A sorting domain-containing protein [Bacteroidota bacterium]MBL6944710.1 T9SS type A sorting domain-containing protein [Bacteroidales bacterium]
MKKMYLMLAGLFLASLLNAQTLLSEDFSSGTMPPSGWIALPLNSGWYSSPTAMAGGSSPECKFEGFTYSGTARLISPYMNMTSVDTAVLMFKHYYTRAGSGLSIGVAIADGTSWIPVWEETPTQNIGPEVITIMLTGTQIGGSNFRFCFYLSGNMTAVNTWYIDDVLMFAPSAFDCQLSSILTPGVITEPTPVVGAIVNLGNTVINEANLTWVSYSGIERDSTFTNLNMAFLETTELTFDGMWISPFGQHDLKMWINSVNGQSDYDQTNDTLVKSIEYQSIVLPRKPLFEEFTSSTCPPCATLNSTFVPWCITHADEITLVKYQMNWPGSGDPYYTAEGGTRRNYYGVNFVPDLYCNGGNISESTSAANAALISALELTSTFDIASTFTISGTNISITTNILPFATNSSLRVHNIVMEKITTGNVGTNGETEFHHVMMKMMPDANGASTSFVNGQPIQLLYNYDLSTTNVEEYDDLIVGVIIQDFSSKEVLQSSYGLQNTVFSDEARLSTITLDGVALEGFDPDIFEYNVLLPPGTIEEPILIATPMDEEALTITSMAFTIPGTAIIDVYAENLFDQTQYRINYSYDYVDIEESPQHLISVYPNPAYDKLFIYGLKNSDISIFSTHGSIVLQKKNFSGSTLDISQLSRGVYVLEVQLNTNQVIRKKILVL